MLVTVISYIGIYLILIFVAGFVADRILRTPGWKGAISDHFDGKKFFNKTTSDLERESRLDLLKWMLTRKTAPWKDREATPVKPAAEISGSEIRATFINHATVLIQTAGLNIITDPVYAKRARPVCFLGPKRHQAPGVAWEDLPRIDVVLLSHNHYDHMDVAALRGLKERFDPLFLAPLGNARFLASKGITAAELDWWESLGLGKGVTARLVPAQHFSARGMSDRDASLWGGYVIGAPSGDIYFAGDTGYGPFVEDIRREYPGGFKLGLVPIGAYKPEWFMREVHMGPREAADLVLKLGIEHALAIHFGTFKLADDGQDEAASALESIKRKKGVKNFSALPNGGIVRVESDR